MQVEVFNAAMNKTYFFPCNAWLQKQGADTSGLRKELVSGSKTGAWSNSVFVCAHVHLASSVSIHVCVYVSLYVCVGAGPVNYRVTTYTSDLRGAGTDADVFIVLYGDKGESGERKLDNSSNNFERNQVHMCGT